MKTLILLFCFTSFFRAPENSAYTPPKAEERKKNLAKIQYGTASYYHKKFVGRKTSSGEFYDDTQFTAAHNSLPMHTWVRVTNVKNKRSVLVRINDRMHKNNTRLVDLSGTAAKKLGYFGRGLTRVKLEVLGKTKPKNKE